MPAPRHPRVARLVERWFAANQRPLPWRRDYDPYRVWISEVMAQQTRLEVVVAYFERFVARFPDIAALARATDDEVTAQWSGLGYYRRARNLRAAAIEVMEKHGGCLPRDVETLLELPGVGRYTAGAICSIAFGRRAPIVDGNIERILARLEGHEEPWRYAEALVARCRSPRDFNQGLMEIGALICRPRDPLCDSCPLAGECVALATGRIAELPRRKAAKAPRAMRAEIYVVRDAEGRLLLRRESGALMDALFHLPHGDTSLFPSPPLTVERGPSLGRFRHMITTRRVEFEVISADVPTGAIRDTEGEYVWVSADDLRRVPHPSYVAKALRLARNRLSPGGVGGIEPS